jgi:hypothetical protein
MEDSEKMIAMEGWKRKVFLIGAVLGALIGLGGAYLFIQRAQDPDRLPSITAGDGVRLGLVVLGLLRSIAELGN